MGSSAPNQIDLFSFAPVVTPHGDGSYTVKPGKPIFKKTPKQAAEQLDISRSSVYRLIEQGKLQAERPTPGKILIAVESINKHQAASKDPEFWEGEKQKAEIGK